MEQAKQTENKAKDYIAVTIGPIFDTMSLVSTPAALWISSYMFSCITRTICDLLLENGVTEEEIITPYYSKTDTELLCKNDGVGLFHDHIIFAAENFEIKKFNDIKESMLQKISAEFRLDYDYLKKYVQIAAVKFKAENPIFGCEHMLNSRELEKPFVAEDTEQPLLKMLFANKDAANEWIKEIAKNLGIFEKWQLAAGESIKDLNTIVNTSPKSKEKMKKHCYYAIVRSDGDNMSKIISSLSGDGQFRAFSKTCLAYCSAVAEAVEKFGGVTIYAGGDDLLAILPCENKDGKTPFEFIVRANEIFDGFFKTYNKPTSLSYGISMCYKKFPLYEALDDSAYLLFGVAKDSKRKNCAVVRLQKHAGQSEGLVIPNAALEEFLNLKNEIVKPGVPTKTSSGGESEEERVIVSALHKLTLFESLLKAAKTDAEKTEEASAQYRENIFTLFSNIFDAKEQQSTFLQKRLPDFYYKLETSLKIDAMTNDGVQNNSVTDIAYVLRMLKFFNEKAGERE